jgi:hypothetical protein
MRRLSVSFPASMLFVVLSSFLVVMTTAFLTIPQVLGGHPGEAGVGRVSSTTYHPT